MKRLLSSSESDGSEPLVLVEEQEALWGDYVCSGEGGGWFEGLASRVCPVVEVDTPNVCVGG